MSDYILELEEACKLLKDICVTSKCETCIFNTNLSKPNCRLMNTPEIWPVNKIFNRDEEKSCSNCKFWRLDKNDENRRCKYCFHQDEWQAESEGGE